MTRAKDISKILTDADISGNIDVDGVTNLDVVDIDGAVDMASTLQVDGAITSSTGMTITTADNNEQLTLISTDADAVVGPVLSMKRDSSSPANNDALGYVKFVGENDASEEVQYVYIQADAVDVSDGTEDGAFEILTQVGGAGKSRINLEPTETVINDTASNIDFRVEGTTNENLFFVDANNTFCASATSNTSQVAGNGVKFGLSNGNGRHFVVGSDTSSGEAYSLYAQSAYRFYVAYSGGIFSTSTSITGISDERLKENIVDLETGLTEIMALKPRRFDWKNGDGKNIAGFVAQEVETVLPDLIGDFKHDELDDAKALKMGDVIPTLVKAIQEQQATIEALTARIVTLESA